MTCNEAMCGNYGKSSGCPHEESMMGGGGGFSIGSLNIKYSDVKVSSGCGGSEDCGSKNCTIHMIDHNLQKVQGKEKKAMDQAFRDSLKLCIGEPNSVPKIVEIFRGLNCKYCGKPVNKWIKRECENARN